LSSLQIRNIYDTPSHTSEHSRMGAVCRSYILKRPSISEHAHAVRKGNYGADVARASSHACTETPAHFDLSLYPGRLHFPFLLHRDMLHSMPCSARRQEVTWSRLENRNRHVRSFVDFAHGATATACTFSSVDLAASALGPRLSHLLSMSP
jgi:hypothetical protein